MRYAGFWRRLVAHLIDFTLMNLLAWLIELILLGGMYAVYWVIIHHQGGVAKSFDDAFSPVLDQILSGVIYVIVAGFYYVIGHHRFETTLGKKPFRVYVVNAADGAPITLKQSVLRYFGYFVSYLPMGCGFLMAALNSEKRTLHDLIAGTVSVIKET